MYQEELYSNVLTDAKKGGYDALSEEVRGLEAVLENFFKKVFESSSSLAERDFNIQTF